MALDIWFYPGCSFETSAGYEQSLNAVCTHLDIRLKTVPDWICCGSSAFFSLQGAQGALPAARVMALAARAGATSLATGCNGCYNTLRKAQKLLDQDDKLNEGIRQQLHVQDLDLPAPDFRIRHLLEVFVQDLPSDAWNKRTDLSGLRAAAYYGCLLTRPWTDVDDPEHPVMLDSFVRSLGFTPVDHGLKTACCGAAHALAYQENTDILVERIIRSMQEKQAEIAVTICPLCQLNLESSQLNLGVPRLPVLFFTQAAGLTLGLSPKEIGLDKLLIYPDIF